MVSKWPVLVFVPLEAGDVDGKGGLVTAAVERLFGVARAEYFRTCTTIAAGDLEVREVRGETGLDVGDDTEVSVSVSVVEIFPDSFAMQALLRAGDDATMAWATLAPVGGVVGDDVRDEFIARAHAARYYN